MAEQQGEDGSMTLAEVAARSRRLLIDWLGRNGYPIASSSIADPFDICTTFLELTSRMMTQPRKIVNAHVALWKDYLDLWQSTTARLLGEPDQPGTSRTEPDPRFIDDAWEDSDIFNFIKHSYLLTSRWLLRTIRDVDGVNPATLQHADYYTRQFVNALSPSNFALTNPEVIRATFETGGENLINGFKNLLTDLDWASAALGLGGPGKPFVLGRSVAATPGKVINRTEMMEIIQYEPLTPSVHRRPLLLVPPWINKFYLFDLRPENSWIRFALEQGHTVFAISWVNPNEWLASRSFEDYVLRGIVAALDTIEAVTGENRINAVGYCIGGTLLATALAYLAARGDERIASASLLATMLDFSMPGELGITIDEAAIACLEEKSAQRGYLDGPDIAILYNMLRESDLIWTFTVNTYLLGKDPFPFDFLYWNADTTRLPHALHSYYLRNFYQHNRLLEPGGISIAGERIDLKKVKVPTYFLATREDHIAPWKSVYAGMRLLGGAHQFALADCGHVTGVINPPAANTYQHWVNAKTPANPDEWLAGAHRERGSWWLHWNAWLTKQSDPETVPARTPGGGLAVLGDAPGSYVRDGA